jgi:hypothetical protein
LSCDIDAAKYKSFALEEYIIAIMPPIRQQNIVTRIDHTIILE